MSVEVLQSAPSAAVRGWQGRCLAGVRRWCRRHGLHWRFEGDAIFRRLPEPLRRACRGQAVIQSDLARLAWMQARLDAGAEAVIWLDADTLVLREDRDWLPTTETHALGREVWVEPGAPGGRCRARVKVHNAFLWFRPGNPMLAFYRDAAERLLLAHRGRHIVPQFVGPKWLSAVQPLCRAPVVDAAAAFSPAVIRELLDGQDGPALRCLRAHSRDRPAVANLCASSVRSGAVDAAMMTALTRTLREPAQRARLQPDAG